MEFTYDAIRQLVGTLAVGGYDIVGYHDWNRCDRCVILRHDVDYDPRKAVELARREASWGVSSTYFFLLTSPLYNALSRECTAAIREVVSLGHEVGLHFDEASHPGSADPWELVPHIEWEAEALSAIAGTTVRSVSMHRPSQRTLQADLRIPGLVNSYGSEFFHGFKYLSDSRRCWREPVDEIVAEGKHERLHILTHAFWYSEVELGIGDAVSEFVNSACVDRYADMSDNITDIGSIMRGAEVLRWKR